MKNICSLFTDIFSPFHVKHDKKQVKRRRGFGWRILKPSPKSYAILREARFEDSFKE